MMTTPSTPPWGALDPGIVDLVRLLWAAGLNPTDSGDGVSKPDAGRVLDVPHVFCRARTLSPANELAHVHTVLVRAGIAAHVEWTMGPDFIGMIAIYPAEDA